MLDDVGMGDFTHKYLNIPLTHYRGFAKIAWDLDCGEVRSRIH